MRELLLILRDILSFKRGPQDLPYAPNLTIVVVVAVVLVQIGINAFGDRPLMEIVPPIVVLNLFSIGVLYLLLHARQHNTRFMQTLLAQALTGVLFLIAMLPLFGLLGDVSPQTATTMTLRPGQALAVLLLLAAAIWKLCVEAHILRHALDVPFFAGILVTLLIGIANVIVLTALFGERAGPTGVGV